MVDTVALLSFWAGLVLGIAAISAVLFIWLRRQLLGADGFALLAFGAVFLGFSSWQSVSVEGAGMKLQLQRVQEQAERLVPIVNEIKAAPPGRACLTAEDQALVVEAQKVFLHDLTMTPVRGMR